MIIHAQTLTLTNHVNVSVSREAIKLSVDPLLRKGA
jgi:hypothetical protein